jgi:dihydrofolate synthase/folylpolyglutamate synthase
VFLEVGLGGRLDATNVISNPLISVITNIDYDHMELLGNDLCSIASEKCGIIKNNGNVVLYPLQQKEVVNLVQEITQKLNNKLYIADINNLKIIDDNIFNMKIEYENKIYDIGLKGEYQIYNTITVICVTNVLNTLGYITTYEDVYNGIKNIEFAGRFEIISNNPLIILDGAHNESGIKAFTESVQNIDNTNKVAIVSILVDKDIKNMCRIFPKYFQRIIVVPINTLRGSNIESLKQEILKYNENVECVVSYENAINIAKNYASKEGAVFIFGSLYLINGIRELIK